MRWQRVRTPGFALNTSGWISQEKDGKVKIERRKDPFLYPDEHFLARSPRVRVGVKVGVIVWVNVRGRVLGL